MFNTVSESPVRALIRPENSLAISDNDIQVRKNERLRQQRPIEKSAPGSDSEQSTRQQEKLSKYKLDDKEIVFEKYDRNGELILRIPPASKPVDEVV